MLLNLQHKKERHKPTMPSENTASAFFLKVINIANITLAAKPARASHSGSKHKSFIHSCMVHFFDRVSI